MNESTDDTLIDSPGGAWFVYGWDWNAYPIGLHTDELGARRMADEYGDGAKVAFWPDGVLWDDVKGGI